MLKKMKILILLFILLLVACSKDDSSTGPKKDVPDAEKSSVEFYGLTVKNELIKNYISGLVHSNLAISQVEIHVSTLDTVALNFVSKQDQFPMGEMTKTFYLGSEDLDLYQEMLANQSSNSEGEMTSSSSMMSSSSDLAMSSSSEEMPMLFEMNSSVTIPCTGDFLLQVKVIDSDGTEVLSDFIKFTTMTLDSSETCVDEYIKSEV